MNTCEKCGKTQEEKYGSGRFCSSPCARSFSTSKNREEINKKKSETLKGKSTWIKGKTLPKNKSSICQKCGVSFLSTKKSKFCDNHSRGKAFHPPRVVKVRTIEEQAKFEINSERSKKAWTPERRALHSEKMKFVVQTHPESYTSSNRGRVKQFEIDGIKLHGTWEVDFYQWAKEKGFNPQRCLNSFPYEWNGTRNYYPDFYISTQNIYVEIKGFETDQDKAKWSHFPEKLIVIRKKEIEEIKKGTYDLYHHISLSK
jgi:hypothetical protein